MAIGGGGAWGLLRTRETAPATSRAPRTTKRFIAPPCDNRARSYTTSTGEENPLDEPVPAGQRDHDGPDTQEPLCAPRVGPAEPQDPGRDDQNDRGLADLDSRVERHERPAEVTARETQVAQDVGEAEAVDQPERERDPGAHVAPLRGQEVVQA